MRRILVGLALTLAVAVAGGCGGAEAEEAAPAPPAAKTVTNGLGQELPPAVTAAVETEGDTFDLTPAGDAVWVQVDPPVDALLRIDTRTGEVTARIEGAKTSSFDGRDLWVATGHSLVRADPESGEIRSEKPFKDAWAPFKDAWITAGEGAVWAYDGARIVRVDPDTEKVVAKIAVPQCVNGREPEAGSGSVWLACKDSGVVIRIDPATNEVAKVIRTAKGAHHLAFGEGSVWVTNYESNTVSRIDPATNRVVATIPEVGEGVGITVGGGAVWAGYDAGIARIDPKTNEVVARLEFGPGLYYGLALVDGSLWATTVTLRHVYKIDPERIS